MKAKLLLSLAALAASTASIAQEGTVRLADSEERPKTRAEVRADLAMWQRAGLGSLYDRDAYNPFDLEIQRRMAEYRRLRNGPEYLAELQRLQGGEQERTASRATQTPSLNN